MSIWTTPSPSDFDDWQDRVLHGEDPSTAAKALGFGGSSTFKRADTARHTEVLDAWRDTQRAEDRKTARDVLREIALDTEAPHAARVAAADKVGKAGLYLTDRVEVTGEDGGPLEIEIREARERLATRIADIAARRTQGSSTSDPHTG